MPDAWVRYIGCVQDQYGLFIHVGVDYGCVTVKTGAGVTLTAEQREEFSQLWVRASHEADRDAELLLALDDIAAEAS